MAQSSPEGIILGKGSQLESLKLSIDKEVVLEMKKEQTKDEFAIAFADWIRVCKLKGRPYNFENIKELLEIYKDEKDL